MTNPPMMELMAAIAKTITDTGLRVGDLPSHLQCWISDDDGDDLGPDVICRLTTGEEIQWWNNGRIVSPGGLIRRCAYMDEARS